MWRRLEQQQYGIDLGTCNTLIYQKDKGIVLQEPSVIAIRKDSGKIEAVGTEAKSMVGRISDQLEVIYPLKDGVIADSDMVSAMMSAFFQKIQTKHWWFRPSKIVVSVPCHITDVKKRAIKNTVVHKSVQQTITIEEPIAAALGAGLLIDKPLGSMVIDLGGGTSQIAILSLGGIVASHSIQCGGVSIDLTIIEYVKKKYKLIIGEITAEYVKKNTGFTGASNEKLEIRGRDMVQGLPKSINISKQEISNLLHDYSYQIVQSIRQVIEKCPPELAGDVMDGGIMLCGGGALLPSIDHYLQNEIQIPIHIAQRPLECIALGTGRLLN